MWKTVALLTAILAPGVCYGATLNGAPTANNGSGGIFVELTAAGSAVTLTGFELFFGAIEPASASVEVYTRPGTYIGFTGDSTGWTLAETASASTVDMLTLTSLNLSSGIAIGAGDTLSVYLHSITAGNGIRYNGTSGAPPTTTWSNGDLSMFSDSGMTGSTPFGGTLFSPRTLAGNVIYAVGGAEIPEPGTVTMLGMGLAGLVWLRRRSG